MTENEKRIMHYIDSLLRIADYIVVAVHKEDWVLMKQHLKFLQEYIHGLAFMNAKRNIEDYMVRQQLELLKQEKENGTPGS